MTDIQAVQSAVETANAKLTEVSSSLDNIQGDITAQGAQIATLTAEVEALQNGGIVLPQSLLDAVSALQTSSDSLSTKAAGIAAIVA